MSVLAGKTLLVVDDEEDLRFLLASTFEDEGVICVEAGTGNEAYGILESNNNIDFVISDVKMPNGSGDELLQKMSNLEKRPPIVMVSGFSDLTSEKALELGALKLMSKPFDLDEIVEFFAEHFS